jgi:hypothetical protein
MGNVKYFELRLSVDDGDFGDYDGATGAVLEAARPKLNAPRCIKL